MPNKFLFAIQLARLHIPTSYLLPFIIASLGGILGSSNLTDLKIIPLFFIGSIFARGAGCIANDIWDRKFDAKVERTKNRPLANGSVSIYFALIQLLIFSSVSLLILITLPKTAIYVSLFTALMIFLYPLMKRITYLPQLFLGFTYSLACIIGYASVTDNVSIGAIILYLSIVFWTVGFDTIYGFMDIKDDKKINVKSMSILLENKNYKAWVAFFYLIFIALFCIACKYEYAKLSLIFYLGVSLNLAILLWQVITLDITQPKNCLTRFKSSTYVGIILLISMFSIKII